MTDYEEYEAECNRIRTENKKILSDFRKWLEYNKLADKTIQYHVSNIDFYINHYLLYQEAIEAKEGHNHIMGFMGDYFIRKAMWASVSNIKQNCTSLKKFYTYMLEKDQISKENLTDLKETIKEECPYWIEELERFDNGEFYDF